MMDKKHRTAAVRYCLYGNSILKMEPLKIYLISKIVNSFNFSTRLERNIMNVEQSYSEMLVNKKRDK